MSIIIAMSSLFAAAILFLLGLFVFLNGKNKLVNYSFASFFGAMSVWHFGIYGLVTGIEDTILLWLYIMAAGLICIPSGFFFFIGAITNTFTKNKVLVSYLISSVFLSLLSTRLLYVGVEKVLFGYVGAPGPLFPLFIFFIVSSLIYSQRVFYQFIKKNKNKKEKPLLHIYYAFWVLTVGHLTVVPTIMGFPILGGFPFWNFITIIYGVIVANAIIKYDLLNLQTQLDGLEVLVDIQNKDIKEKKKLEKDIETASGIQKKVLPKYPPMLKNYSIDAKFIPSRVVSGDYYDFFTFSETKVGILIADIAGKGVAAAFLMMILKDLVHQLIKSDYSPQEFITILNNEIVSYSALEKQIPITYGILDTNLNTFTYCNAGHDPGLYISNYKFEELEVHGMATGFCSNEAYEESKIVLSNEDIILLFTDGLPDVRNEKNESFGLSRVEKIIQKYKEGSSDRDSLLNVVWKEWDEFRNKDVLQKDDMTLICIEQKQLNLIS